MTLTFVYRNVERRHCALSLVHVRTAEANLFDPFRTLWKWIRWWGEFRSLPLCLSLSPPHTSLLLSLKGLKVLYLSSPPWYQVALVPGSAHIRSAPAHLTCLSLWKMTPHGLPILVFPHVSTWRVRKWHWQLFRRKRPRHRCYMSIKIVQFLITSKYKNQRSEKKQGCLKRF